MSQRTRLSIGMAHFEDFDGVYFTLQSMRLHQELLPGDQLIVIDNSPATAAGAEVKTLCETIGAKYVAFANSTGTTQTREQIFREATGDAVVVMDCHVILPSGTIAKLRQWYDEHTESKDLYQGPMLLDTLRWTNTHFDLKWRGQMWGVWGTAWRCQHGIFSVQDDAGNAKYVLLDREMSSVPPDWGLPSLPFAGHEEALMQRGFKPAASGPSDEPFEIPAQGLGLFSCRRDAWLGFNPHFRAFGGEEGYIHEKFRQAGRKAICLPFLAWLHRFGRPGGVKYRLSQEDKVRNYVLGFRELGMNVLSIREHFLAEGMQSSTWDVIASDPVNVQINYDAPIQSQSGRPVLMTQPSHVFDLDGLFNWTARHNRDLNEHLPLLKLLASRCDHVTEMTKRRESSIGLVAGQPQMLVSYQEENDAILDLAQRYKHPDTNWELNIVSLEHAIPEPHLTDMLFIDTRHNADRARRELTAWAPLVKRYIVLHDTEANGQVGDNGGAGLLPAIRELVERGEWFVAGHQPQQYGMTVLSQHPDDRPSETIWLWPPGYGPGTEMFEMLHAMGVDERPNCTCKATADQMDKWGVAGCRVPQNFQWILDRVNENATNWSWTEKLQIAAKAATDPANWRLAWRINPMDLNRSLIEEAIRRAEAKQNNPLKIIAA